MNEAEYQQLKQASWLRDLSAAEQTRIQRFVAGHPEFEPDWHAESLLNSGLRDLPDAPVASNFTAQVVGALQRDGAAIVPRERKSFWPAMGTGFRWVPRFAVAGLAVGIGLLSIQQHRLATRVEMARSVAEMSTVASMPHEWLEDFDAIHTLNRLPPPVDHELLALLEL